MRVYLSGRKNPRKRGEGVGEGERERGKARGKISQKSYA